MTFDLTGGIDPSREYVLAPRPQNPEMRDSVSFWVVDDRGEIGLPRIGIEAVGANWDAHDVQVNVAFPDGRVYRLRTNGPSLPAEGPDGRATVLGAGGLVFRCIEPFDKWTMSYDGPAVQTSSADLVAGKKDGPLVDISFRVEAKMAVPPWVQGALQPDAGAQLKTSIEGNLMGGPRYEQLFTATGEFHAAGAATQFHRQRSADPPHWRAQACRILGTLLAVGRVSQRARVRLYRLPTTSRRPAHLQRGLRLHRRRRPDPGPGGAGPVACPAPTSKEDVSLVLETADGVVEIAGETVFSTHDIHHNDDMYSMHALKQEMPSFPALQQAGVRYKWDGEQTYGMLERSNPIDKIARG